MADFQLEVLNWMIYLLMVFNLLCVLSPIVFIRSQTYYIEANPVIQYHIYRVLLPL